MGVVKKKNRFQNLMGMDGSLMYYYNDNHSWPDRDVYDPIKYIGAILLGKNILSPK